MAPKSIRSRRVPRISLPSRARSSGKLSADLNLLHPKRDQAGRSGCTVSTASTSSASSSPNKAVYAVAKEFPDIVSTSTTNPTETCISSTSSTNPSCAITGVESDVFAHYRVMSGKIGSGKYGSVRECVHRTTGKIFAVKSINKSKVSKPDYLRQEIVNLSRVNHGNIIKMVDCFEDSDFLHIVTDKYGGGELFDKIIRNRTNDGCFSEAKASSIIRSLLEAVEYLHNRDLVHRDIKPENIVFAHDGEDSDIKLIDFGLSRSHPEDSKPMTNPVGTSYYMAPEVLERNYTRSCDVWSVGVVAYILLCGYPPFNGSDEARIQEAILAGKLRFTGKAWSNKSADAKQFISLLLSKDKNRLSIKQALNHPWIVQNEIDVYQGEDYQ